MTTLILVLIALSTIIVLAWYVSQLRYMHNEQIARKTRRSERRAKIAQLRAQYDTDHIPDDMTISYIMSME